ncbi:hypothetical protein TOPH_04918, partial [Tolypocladium ophioglossoides CBS 100239]
ASGAIVSGFGPGALGSRFLWGPAWHSGRDSGSGHRGRALSGSRSTITPAKRPFRRTSVAAEAGRPFSILSLRGPPPFAATLTLPVDDPPPPSTLHPQNPFPNSRPLAPLSAAPCLSLVCLVSHLQSSLSEQRPASHRTAPHRIALRRRHTCFHPTLRLPACLPARPRSAAGSSLCSHTTTRPGDDNDKRRETAAASPKRHDRRPRTSVAPHHKTLRRLAHRNPTRLASGVL